MLRRPRILRPVIQTSLEMVVPPQQSNEISSNRSEANDRPGLLGGWEADLGFRAMLCLLSV